VRASGNGVKWQCIDEENNKDTGIGRDPNKVVLANYAFPERERETFFDSKNLCKAGRWT
jgi:hypothetical protein